MALALGVATVAVGGLASAAPQSDAYSLTANMKARFEVPKAVRVPAGATGVFTGRAVELESGRARISWRLTYSKLSGRAVAAHIHLGRPGRAGRVMVGLCGPCRSGQRGVSAISHAQLRTIRAGGAYVNVHTVRNQAGEIRGRIKASEALSGGGDPSPPPTTPEPPLYP